MYRCGYVTAKMGPQTRAIAYEQVALLASAQKIHVDGFYFYRTCESENSVSPISDSCITFTLMRMIRRIEKVHIVRHE
jgi:hypothetical protein